MNTNSNYTLITGASAGIGKALAVECAKRQQQLVLVALDQAGLQQAATAIQKEFNVDVKILAINLLKPEAAQDLFEWCNRQNLLINVLINNAGAGNYSSFEDTPIEKYLQLISLNAEVVVKITKAFLPMLKANPESYILNLGSFVSFLPVPYKSVYSATKSFVLTFSRALQTELGQYGVHISCLCPGPTLTETVKKRNSHLISNSSDIMTMSPEAVAKAGIDGLFKKKGVIIPGWKNRLILALTKIIPFRLKSYILNNIFSDKIENEQPIPVKEEIPIKEEIMETPVMQIDGLQPAKVPQLKYTDREKMGS